MTASAKGTVENSGKNVKQKSGLNRAILRTGFYSLYQAIEWQLLKVGGVVIPVDPRGTSITCPHCQTRDKRNRPRQAIFKCINKSCGFKANADVNVLRKGRTGPRKSICFSYLRRMTGMETDHSSFGRYG